MALFSGPVSANPIGLYEGWWGHVFKPGEPELRWNAFNAGELLLPHSAGSLLFPALVVVYELLIGRRILVAGDRLVHVRDLQHIPEWPVATLDHRLHRLPRELRYTS